MVRLSREFQSLVERVFSEGVETGDFRPQLNPQLAMLALLGLCNSVIGSRSLPRGVTIDALIDEYCQIFTGGICGSSDGPQADRTRVRQRPSRRQAP